MKRFTDERLFTGGWRRFFLRLWNVCHCSSELSFSCWTTITQTTFFLRPKGEGLKTENRGRHFAKVSDWLTTLMKRFSTTNSSKSNEILTQLIHHKRSRRKLSTDKFCYDWLVATITVITNNMLIRNSFKVK